MPTWFREGVGIKGKSQQTAVKTGNGAKHELRNVPELVPMAAFPIHIPAKFKTVCPSSPPHPTPISRLSPPPLLLILTPSAPPAVQMLAPGCVRASVNTLPESSCCC